MATFKLKIELGNDAMRTSRDLARALREMGERVMAAIPGAVNRADWGRIRDENGNSVGTWQVVADPPREGRFSVAAGRQVLRDGKPFLSVGREGETHPGDADEATRFFAEALNRRDSEI